MSQAHSEKMELTGLWCTCMYRIEEKLRTEHHPTAHGDEIGEHLNFTEYGKKFTYWKRCL